ncbi:amidase [Dactylosporangium sp. NPDC000555]|uniref:amidase n=1 Tax=Dactylosporangium sp. NPDC000555 TaxID=3154260 RepID=UPI0033210128
MIASSRLPSPPDAICRMSVRELAAQYATGALSPVQALEAVLARADEVNPQLSALYWRMDETAMAAAVASQERWARGEPLSRLDGIPITAKDILDVAGAPTYLGSATNGGVAASTASDPFVAAFVDRGAVLFAKSTMVETGLYSASFSALYGPARNPWNLGKSTNGSSSGGAAATAAYLGPLHLGTDGGGSLRSPAAACGCVALKATANVAPFGAPAGDLPGSAAVKGFLTRDIDDQLFVHAELTGAAPPAVSPTLGDLRIGYLSRPASDPGIGEVQPVIRAAIEDALDLLAVTGPGPVVEELPDPVFAGPMWQAAVESALRAVGQSRQGLPAELRDRAHPVVHENVARAMTCTEPDETTLGRLRALLDAGGRRLRSHFERYDVLVLACTYYPSFDAELPWHPDCAMIESAGYGWTAGACPHLGWAGGGPPSISIPCGLDTDGVPIGMLLVGRPGHDVPLLHTARQIAQRLRFAPLF